MVDHMMFVTALPMAQLAQGQIHQLFQLDLQQEQLQEYQALKQVVQLTLLSVALVLLTFTHKE
ncbi:MAG: hypothetical protein EBT15_12470 [Betaproteobacteria bacterium]|nr:hypothetical protein [Betaproteobacteria bacterium]